MKRTEAQNINGPVVRSSPVGCQPVAVVTGKLGQGQADMVASSEFQWAYGDWRK
ncbi:MAG: hypothetical protein ACK493_09335 [Planctomycetota bacterium]|nr:hypothetical protein [Blastopirellula sp.]